MTRGAFGLRTPTDLLHKLHHDYDVLRGTPTNPYAAFNFFVTAEHLIDWLHPGSAKEADRRTLRSSDTLLQVVSHLANGAKHFSALSKHHRSVRRSGLAGGYFSTSYFGPRHFGTFFGAGRQLVVDLEGDAAKAYGDRIPVLDLATKVLDYWDLPGRIP